MDFQLKPVLLNLCGIDKFFSVLVVNEKEDSSSSKEKRNTISDQS